MSRPIKHTEIKGEVSGIEIIDVWREAPEVRVKYMDGATERHVSFRIDIHQLSCVAQEVRRFLRSRRTTLNTVIANTEEKV